MDDTSSQANLDVNPSPNAADHYIGQRLKGRRLFMRITLDALAHSIGAEPDQVERFELGLERIEGEMLFEIATLLKVPITFFFRDYQPAIPVKSRSWLRNVDRWFVENVSQYERTFLSLAKRMTGNSDAARDLVQDAYAQVLTDDRWATISAPRAYLQKIIFNLGVNRIKRARIITLQPLPDHETIDYSDLGPDAFQALSARQELELLTRAINKLPPQCRRVIMMRKIEGISPRDIAVDMGISLSTVETHLSRGLVLLAKHLNEMEAPPLNEKPMSLVKKTIVE